MALTNRICSLVDGLPNPIRVVLESWHGQLFDGLPPVDYYAGYMRGIYSDKPCLAVDVAVGRIPGFPHTMIDAAMQQFDLAVSALLSQLDSRYLGASPDPDVDFLLEAIAWITAEFIRVHPFLNGNGRTSRFISNALLFRYGFRFDTVRINPRPDTPYEVAGQAAMLGDHGPMRDFLLLCVTHPRN